MLGRAWIVVMSVASTARAEIPPDLLANHNFKAPTTVFESPTARVATATKAGKARIVLVTATDKVVDGGAVGKGTLVVTQPALTPGLVILELAYTTRRGTATDTASQFWVVRDSGTTACRITASQTTSIGAACGSSGWTAATLTITPDGKRTLLDVRYDNSGHYSVADGKGGCLQRSPVNSRHVTRWIIGPTGSCKQGTAPEDDGAP